MSFLTMFVKRPAPVDTLRIDPDYLKRRIDELSERVRELEHNRTQFHASYIDCLDRFESILRRMTARLQRAQEREEAILDVATTLGESDQNVPGSSESVLDLKKRLRG